MQKSRKQIIEANEFAMKLLMPESQFVEIFKKYNGDFLDIANIFGVSVAVCKARALNLGLIDNI
jgi:Zn-dependent peptidase ImmA (M78 family)